MLVRLEVRNFYPWLRGSERFARIGAWLYGQTQLRIHRLVCNAFLRSLGRRLTPTQAAPRVLSTRFAGAAREGAEGANPGHRRDGLRGRTVDAAPAGRRVEVRLWFDQGRRPGAEAAVELAAGDLTRPAGLAGALDGVRAAYFLVHMIGGDDDYPAIERAAAGASVALPARPRSSGLSTSAVSATSASSISQLGTTPRSRFATRAPR